MSNVIPVDFNRYSSDPNIAPARFTDREAARDFLSSLKCYPHGVLSVTFDLSDDDGPARLEGSMYTLDSEQFDFAAEEGQYEPLLEAYTTQTFSTALSDEEWQDRTILLANVGRLVCSFMAHEALEWLRFEDGVHVHDPHLGGKARTAP